MPLDLRNDNYDEFVRLVFDHPVPAGESAEDLWYWQDEFDWLHVDPPIDPSRQVELLTAVCRQSASLSKTYTADQIEQGVLFVFGVGGRDAFQEPLWNEAVPLNLRVDCISGIADLYEQLLAPLALYSSTYMLWDGLVYNRFGSLKVERPVTDDEEHMRLAMFDSLCSILEMNSELCQRGALHGLYHLNHSRGPAVIRDFIRKGRAATGEIAEYAAKCLEGPVL